MLAAADESKPHKTGGRPGPAREAAPQGRSSPARETALHGRVVAAREAALHDWKPRVHYAQFETLPPCLCQARRLYNFELLYVCNGALATTVEGVRHTLAAGQMLLMPPGVLHQNEIVSAPSARLLGIHFEFFQELNIQSDEDMVMKEEGEPGVFAAEARFGDWPALSGRLVYEPSAECVQQMEQLVQEFTMRPFGYELACRGLLLGILAQLLRSLMADRLAGATVHQEAIRTIVRQIEQHPAEQWSAARIAELLGMSDDHAAKLFRQTVGMPPGALVRSIRHRLARSLLRNTSWSIEQIGLHIGYPSIHYFSRVFTANEGMPPRAYRKLTRIV